MAGSQNGNESSKEYEINRASVVVPHDEENPTTMAGLHSRDESSEECPNNAAPFVIPHDEEQPATMASSHSGHETLKEYQINKAPVVVPHNEEKPTVMTGSHSENESSEENQNSNAPIVPGDEEQPATIAGLHSGNEFSKDYPNNNAAVVSHDQEPPVTNKAGPGLTKLPAGAAATAERDQMNQAKEPPAAVPEAKEPMVPFFKLFSFADNYDYTLMFFGTIGAFVHGTALPLFFLFFGRVLNGFGGVTADPISTVNKYSLALLYLGLACLFSAWLEVSFWTQTGTRQSAKMRAKYLEAILRQDVEYFDTDSNTGSFITSISSDPLSMQDAISEKLGSTLHCVATFVTGFGVAFGSEWRIALLTIAVLPFIVLVVGLFAWSLTTSTSRASAAYAEGGMVAEQAIAQIRVLYSFVGESKFIKDYHNALQKTLKLGARAGLAKGLGIGAIYGVLFASWALLLWYGGKLIRQGTGNGGQTLSAIFAIIIGGMSLGQVMPNVAVVAKGRGAAFRIFKLISHEARINKPDSKAKMLDSVEGRIELRNVDFSYPSRPDVPIFQNFSLTIPTGKTLAIVGTSGSGKSTVVSLIERFYDPTGGEILFDGHDLRSLNIVWLRDQIGLVNQEPVLFATTIKANMLYGKGNASEAEIWAAAKAANVDSFIDQLPHKYETQVGERGVQLSGGEKQRVAIARAMLKNPSVLLLDEATSALDAGSEQVVQEALNRLMVGRTTVIVAHRLSTIRNANTIAVVQQGRIIETGTHDELVSRPDGAYSTLVRLQELAETKDGSKRNSFEELVSLERQGNGVELAMHNRISLRLSHDQRKSVDSSRRWSLSQKGNWEDNELSPQKGFLRRLLMISKADWPFGLGGVLGSMLAGTLNPLYAWLVSTVVVEYYDKNFHHMRSEVSKYALAFVSLGAAAPFFYTLQHYSWGVTGERLVNRVREMMFGRILRNEVGWFDRDENSSSQILARLSSDATTVRAALGDRISILVQNLTLMLLAFIYSLVIQWKMTFVMASVVPLILVSFVAVNLFTRGFAGDVAKAYSRATQVAAEATANIRTVAAFNAEDKVQRLFVSELEGPLSKSFLMGHVSGFLFGLSQLMMYGAYGLGLWYAGQLIKKNEASFLQVLRVFLIMVVVAFSIAETMTLAPDLVKGGQAVESVFQVLDRKTEIDPEKPKGDRIKNLGGDVELKNVAFVYPSRPDVLIFSDLNLKVCAGRSLALVGASGSGKSTVISLIERFYDPSSGAVLIDGKDIRNYNLRSLRKHIALVIQEPVLFSVSIQENILFGRSRASEAEVIEAAKAANAHNFISALPQGYQTLVGERGIQLSGGQKQRVAIARAVLKDPRILLLDEATSALDAESERVVQGALDRLMKSRTTVIVAHRLSTIRGADSIAVIEDGAVLEEGSHADLVRKNGGYARLVNLQAGTDDSVHVESIS